MTYELAFNDSAFKEWRKPDAAVREQFKKNFAERLVTPRIPSAKLRSSKDRYKIKLRSAGYRLVYEVVDDMLIVVVIAVGSRNRNEVYRLAEKRGRKISARFRDADALSSLRAVPRRRRDRR